MVAPKIKSNIPFDKQTERGSFVPHMKANDSMQVGGKMDEVDFRYDHLLIFKVKEQRLWAKGS